MSQIKMPETREPAAFATASIRHVPPFSCSVRARSIAAIVFLLFFRHARCDPIAG